MAIEGIVRTIACWESFSNDVGAQNTYRYAPSQANYVVAVLLAVTQLEVALLG